MSPSPDDPWEALQIPPDSTAQEIERLTRALARERSLRDRTERELEDRTRELYFAYQRTRHHLVQLHEAERREVERLQDLLALAKNMQAALLPRDLWSEGLELAAATLPCAEMGGDYYDVRPVEDGCWIGIGDVSGHGISAGLVMLMVQSIAAALIRCDRKLSPSEVLVWLNEVLFDNIRGRMGGDNYVTASLLRFTVDGRVAFAGAHEDLIVLRAGDGRCERVETHGAWLGVLPDIRHACAEQQLTLGPGDLLVLHTDGMTEAMDGGGRRFGIERLCEEIERLRGLKPQVVIERLFDRVMSFAGPPADDVTLVVIRYRGPGDGRS